MKVRKLLSLLLVTVVVFALLPTAAPVAVADTAAQAPIRFCGYQVKDTENGKMDVRLLALVDGLSYDAVGLDVYVTDVFANKALTNDTAYINDTAVAAATKSNSAAMTTTTVYSSVNVDGVQKDVVALGGTIGDYIVVMTVTDIPCGSDLQFDVTPYVTKDGSSTYGATGTAKWETVALSLADGYTFGEDVTAVTLGGTSVTVANNALSASALASFAAGSAHVMTVTTASGTATCGATVATKVLKTHDDLVAFKTMQSATQALEGYFVLGNDITAPTGGYTLAGKQLDAGGTYTAANASTGGFRGTFDGRGYTVSGYTFGVGGLFGDVQAGASVKNLTVKAATVQGNGGAVLGSAVFEASVYACAFNVSLTDGDAGYALGYYLGSSALANIALNLNWGGTADAVLANTAESSTALNVAVNQKGTLRTLFKEDTAETAKQIAFNMTVDAKMSAMSFNLRYDTADTDKARIVAQIKTYMPDTIGVQEATGDWLNYLESSETGLGEYYTCVRGKHRDEGRWSLTNEYSDGEYNAIFYRKDKFTVIESGTHWLNKNLPTSPSKVSGSENYRIMTYAVLERISDDRRILVVNTHLDVVQGGQDVRREQAGYLLEFLAKHPDLPIVCTGDFNDEYETDTTKNNVYNKMVAEATRLGDPMTMVGVTPTSTQVGVTRIIDFCYVSKDMIVPTKYKVCNETSASDHYPVYIEYRLYDGSSTATSLHAKASGTITTLDFFELFTS